MRRLFWQMMVSLDGFMEGPNGELDWHIVDGDFDRYVANMLDSIDAILLGRVTYQALAAYWPSATNPEAARMNALPKVVFSRKLERVDWQNSRLVKGDAGEEIARLKQQPGHDLAIFGSADLASTPVRLGLIDEFRILLCPVVLGGGRPMFPEIKGRTFLKLVRTEIFGSGVVVLSFQPTRTASR